MSNFETMQKFNKDQLDAANAAAVTLTKGLQKLAAEATDYSKAAFEKNSAAFEKLVAAKTPDAAFQIQSEFAKTAYESLVAQVSKMGELYTNFAKEAFKPVEVAFTKATEIAKKAA